MAVGQGFEPREGFPSTVFKTAAFDHSASPPYCCLPLGEGADYTHPGAANKPESGGNGVFPAANTAAGRSCLTGCAMTAAGAPWVVTGPRYVALCRGNRRGRFVIEQRQMRGFYLYVSHR